MFWVDWWRNFRNTRGLIRKNQSLCKSREIFITVQRLKTLIKHVFLLNFAYELLMIFELKFRTLCRVYKKSYNRKIFTKRTNGQNLQKLPVSVGSLPTFATCSTKISLKSIFNESRIALLEITLNIAWTQKNKSVFSHLTYSIFGPN